MAVHREKYTNYDGPLDDSGGWWVVAAHTVKSIVGFLRTKLIVPLLWIAPLVAAVAVVGEYAVRGKAQGFQPPTGSSIVVFLQIQFYSLAVLYMASGAGVVSHDLRYQTTQLYFSKPLEKWEYAFGKLLGLVLLGSLVTVGPAIGVGVLRIALLSQYGLTSSVAIHVALGVGVSFAMTCVVAAVILGLSSTTTRTGFVVLAWIGVLFVPPVVAFLVGLSLDNSDLPGLLSMQANLQMLSSALIEGSELDVPVIAPVLCFLLFGAAGLGANWWRLQNLEGVK